MRKKRGRYIVRLLGVSSLLVAGMVGAVAAIRAKAAARLPGPSVLVEEMMIAKSTNGNGDYYLILPDSEIVIIKPTSTALPTATAEPEPTVTATAEHEGQRVQVRLSHYWPPLLGVNCHPANVHSGQCHARLYGKEWQEWVGVGLACPMEWPLGTEWHIPALGKTFICVDRGGAIQSLEDGSVFVDLLQPDIPYVHNGTVVRDQHSPSGAYLVEAWVTQ